MSNSPQFQFLLLFSLLSTISVSQPTQQFYYADFSKAGTTISLQNSAKLTNHNKNIQLTNTTSKIMGHAFYASKLNFSLSSYSFSTAFTFGTAPEFRQLGGHGMAFVISPHMNLNTALPSQYLGLFNASDLGNFTNHVFAVEFDTVKDFEYFDIDDNHVGIDIDSLISNFSAPAGYFLENSTKVNVSMKAGKTIQAWIDYDSNTHLINVTISPFGEKPKLPLISYKYDLSQVLFEEMYIGFSASTGLLASSHYVLGWSFNMSGPARSIPMAPLPVVATSGKNNHKLTLGLSVSLSIFFFLVVIGALYLVKRIRDADIIEDWELTIGPHRFPYEELKQATKGFKDKDLLGRGGFGRVYKGTLPKGNIQIAVKRISHESKQGLKEFLSEIGSIGLLRHRNLVQLLGWCRRRGDLLLVYDYMPYGSLDRYLFSQPKDDPNLVLSWDQRFKIIKGVASGLLYLHQGWEKVVIHRDIKASNVLLDTDFNGRLGDFGLARLHDHGAGLGTTRIVGTLGYLAPEFSRTGHVTTSSDVFAFGALMLEVVCGRRPIEPKAARPEETVLADWVWDNWREGTWVDVVDPRLRGQFNEEEALVMVRLGLMCSSEEPRYRPSMRLVVQFLEGEMALPKELRAPFSDDERRSMGENRIEDYVYSFATTSSGVSLQSHSAGNGSRGNAAGYASLNTTTSIGNEETSILRTV